MSDRQPPALLFPNACLRNDFARSRTRSMTAPLFDLRSPAARNSIQGLASSINRLHLPVLAIGHSIGHNLHKIAGMSRRTFS